jgi:capsule biosynthesis phosphatase
MKRMKKQFSYFGDRKILFVDLDNTICISEKNVSYEEQKVDLDIVMAIKKAINRNFNIVINTSRGVRTFKGNEIEIKKYIEPTITNWLKEKKIPYSSLLVGKPWCGYDGWYVDDRALTLNQFKFKFNSTFSKYTFDILIPCYNEQNNISKLKHELDDLEKYININKILLINNGSIDGTDFEINSLLKLNKIYQKINIKKNIGYGYGLKKALNLARSDLIMILHADLQFKPSAFLIQNIDNFKGLEKGILYSPIRLGRKISSQIASSILRKVLSIILFKQINDFNGQPKIFFRNDLSNKINNLPNNYTFDLALNLIFRKVIYLPIIEGKREFGKSSWQIRDSVKIFLSYVIFAIKYKLWK